MMNERFLRKGIEFMRVRTNATLRSRACMRACVPALWGVEKRDSERQSLIRGGISNASSARLTYATYARHL